MGAWIASEPASGLLVLFALAGFAAARRGRLASPTDMAIEVAESFVRQELGNVTKFRRPVVRVLVDGAFRVIGSAIRIDAYGHRNRVPYCATLSDRGGGEWDLVGLSVG